MKKMGSRHLQGFNASSCLMQMISGTSMLFLRLLVMRQRRTKRRRRVSQSLTNLLSKRKVQLNY